MTGSSFQGYVPPRELPPRPQSDLKRLMDDLSAKQRAFKAKQAQRQAKTPEPVTKKPPKHLPVPRPRPLDPDMPLHFSMQTPPLVGHPDNTDLASALTTVTGHEVKTFGSNLSSEQLGAACELARRQKNDWTNRVHSRAASYYKVSDEWAKRKGVDPSQMNSVKPGKLPRPEKRDHSHHYSPPPPIKRGPTPEETELEAKRARHKHHHHKRVKHHRTKHESALGNYESPANGAASRYS